MKGAPVLVRQLRSRQIQINPDCSVKSLNADNHGKVSIHAVLASAQSEMTMLASWSECSLLLGINSSTTQLGATKPHG
jgi:hypothetical protein